jgi:hypothetical protein
MPRNNRSRSRRSDKPAAQLGEERLFAGWKRTEHRRDGEWFVQPITGAQAVKRYSCPGCALGIEVGTAHVVTWRADGVLGDPADLAARRHWHTHCWRIRA